MSTLSVTLIDVGWGDSIFLESQPDVGPPYFALIDSNDKDTLRSSYIFLKKYFERRGDDVLNREHVFDFVMLSHDHMDHGQGLKALMREFGTRQFWYSKTKTPSVLSALLEFAGSSPKVLHHEAVNSTKTMPTFGDAHLEVWWPPYVAHDEDCENDENNNSIVLYLKLKDVAFLLTGDAEERVWQQISARIGNTVKLFKVPHHGSKNGTFGASGSTSWLDRCSPATKLAISSHVRPFHHPHPSVIEQFNTRQRTYFRTDENYHLTFKTDGTTLEVKYSHF